jgi:hypothetical protein
MEVPRPSEFSAWERAATAGTAETNRERGKGDR